MQKFLRLFERWRAIIKMLWEMRLRVHPRCLCHATEITSYPEKGKKGCVKGEKYIIAYETEIIVTDYKDYKERLRRF